MKAGGYARIVLASVLLLGAAGCTRTGDNFLLTNELDVPVRHWIGMSPEEPSGSENPTFPAKPGASKEVHLVYDDPVFPWSIWPVSYWAPASCRDDLYLFVEAEDGREFVHDPPLCNDDHWIISE